MLCLTTRPSSLRRLLVAAAACLPALLSFPSHADTAKKDAPATKVRYEEVVRSVLYMPMYVALDKGFFKDAGLDVTMKTSQGTDKGMAALLSGSADIVLIGPEASLYVANSESPVKPKVFAGLTATDGFLLLSRKPVEKFDWNMLKGQKIMSFRPGSNPDVFLETALRKHGLDPKKDVKLVNNIGAAARAGAWMAGQTDYAIFLEPEAGNMEKSGNGQVVASIGDEVGQVDFTVFTATDEYLKQNPKVAQAWTDAIYRAQKHVQTASPEEIATHLASYFPGMSKDELVATVKRYRQHDLWKKTPVVEASAINTLQDMLIASGQMEQSKRVPYEQVVVNTFAAGAK